MELDREIRETKAIAALYRRRGRHALATEILQTALAIQKNVYGETALPVAVTLYEIGETLCDMGNYAEAKKYFAEAVNIWQKHNPDDFESVLYHSNALTRLQERAEIEQRWLQREDEKDDRGQEAA